MLLKDFYKVLTLEDKGAGKYNVQILVNENHDVFKGHFPGNPIMPGVCMMQIIKELTSQVTNAQLMLQSLNNVKFMALINPFVTPQLTLELEVAPTTDLVKVKAVTLFNDTVALKFSAVYKILAQ